MKYELVSLFTLFIMFALLTSSCTKEENSVNPPTSGNYLINTSFEKNGFFSADGWSLPSNIDSSSLVPLNGGKYSLGLESVSPPEEFAEIKVPVLTQFNNYKFSFWSYSNAIYGRAILSLLRNGSIIDSMSISIQELSWYNYTISDTFNVAAGDSFLVQFSGGTSPVLFGETYFDLCTLEAVE